MWNFSAIALARASGHCNPEIMGLQASAARFFVVAGRNL
jgi:hypothetical protein